jgi:hypothetical protein
VVFPAAEGVHAVEFREVLPLAFGMRLK